MIAASLGAGLVTPTLTHIADFLVEVGAPIAIGETAQGLSRVVPITGGIIQGLKPNGTILNAGADFQIIRPDAFTRLEARYVGWDAGLRGKLRRPPRPPCGDGAPRPWRAGRPGRGLFPQRAALRPTDGLLSFRRSPCSIKIKDRGTCSGRVNSPVALLVVNGGG